MKKVIFGIVVVLFVGFCGYKIYDLSRVDEKEPATEVVNDSMDDFQGKVQYLNPAGFATDTNVNVGDSLIAQDEVSEDIIATVNDTVVEVNDTVSNAKDTVATANGIKKGA